MKAVLSIKINNQYSNFEAALNENNDSNKNNNSRIMIQVNND